MVIGRAARYQEYVIDDPTVVFEILSDTTAQTDFVRKNTEYAGLSSVQRYAIMDQRMM
jgi:Uma2 family endonuclease